MRVCVAVGERVGGEPVRVVFRLSVCVGEPDSETEGASVVVGVRVTTSVEVAVHDGVPETERWDPVWDADDTERDRVRVRAVRRQVGGDGVGDGPDVGLGDRDGDGVRTEGLRLIVQDRVRLVVPVELKVVVGSGEALRVMVWDGVGVRVPVHEGEPVGRVRVNEGGDQVGV